MKKYTTLITCIAMTIGLLGSNTYAKPSLKMVICDFKKMTKTTEAGCENLTEENCTVPAKYYWMDGDSALTCWPGFGGECSATDICRNKP